TPADTYTCTGSSACLLEGQQGVCEPSGFCSFPDTMCPSGKRYGDFATSDLAGQCVASIIQCGNGMDDDGDGLVDSMDPGCTSPQDPDEHGDTVCDNGSDDDNDGRTDFRVDGLGDPGCTDPLDASEHGTAQCDNGADDDSDGAD